MHARLARHLLPLLAAAVAAGCLDPAPAAIDVGAEIERAGPVTLLAPAHGERVDGRNVTFSWALEGNASDWVAAVLLDGAPAPGCPGAAGRVSCTLALDAGRIHRWTVQATPAAGEGPARLGNDRGFVTNAPPGAPSFDAGDDGATQVPLELWLGWHAPRDPEGDPLTYRVAVRNATGERVACEGMPEPECTVPWRLRPAEALEVAVTARDSFGLEGPPATLRLTATRPVVLLHGWTGDETTWAIMAPELVSHGFEVLDFDAARPGLQLHRFAPDERVATTIEEIARELVLPGIRGALVEAGFAADTPVDVVAHSMGGLVSRVLVEQQGAGAQLATVTMVGTPNRGSPMSGPWLCRSAADEWRPSCLQMEAGSPFLDGLGYAPSPATTSYATIGGGRDTVAPDRSVRLDGVPHLTVRNACHSGTECAVTVEGDVVPLTGSREVRDALLDILALRPGPS